MYTPPDFIDSEMPAYFPPAPAWPSAPLGMPKSSTAAVEVPELETVASLPAGSVSTLPTFTVAAAPGAPSAPFGPVGPCGPAGPVGPASPLGPLTLPRITFAMLSPPESRIRG